jgi:hypothetical protein
MDKFQSPCFLSTMPKDNNVEKKNWLKGILFLSMILKIGVVWSVYLVFHFHTFLVVFEFTYIYMFYYELLNSMAKHKFCLQL